MQITKTVETTYEVDLLNTAKTPITIARAINELAEAGVDMQHARFEDGDRSKTFNIIVSRITYYDDSTLKRMEA